MAISNRSFCCFLSSAIRRRGRSVLRSAFCSDTHASSPDVFHRYASRTTSRTDGSLTRARFLFAVLVFSVSATMTRGQTTYYVDPEGNDRARGRSPGAAWKSIAKVNDSRFSPGDRILFKRGGTWWEELRPPSSGKARARILFGAYGRGPAPVIDAGGVLEGGSDPDRWQPLGEKIWQMRVHRFPGRLWLGGREYGASGNAGGRGSTTPDARYRWWANAAGVLKVFADGNPAGVYGRIEVANQGRRAMVIENKQWLVFKGLHFRRGEVCIDVRNGDRLLFDSCTVLGGTSKYGLWLRGGSDRGEIRRSVFDREDTVMHTFEFTGEAGNGNGQDNIALQWANEWDIHHSVLANPGHDAIQLSGERSGDETWTSNRNRIHHNRVYMVGDYGRFTTTNAKGDPDFCADNEIYCNEVRDMTVQCQILGRNNFVHDNLFMNYRKIPFDKLHYRSCVIDLSDYLDPAGDGNRIWHNTFVDCDAHAISVSGGTRRASIRNNLIVNTGRLTGVGGHDFLDHVGIVIWPGATTDTVANNVIWTGGKAPVVYQQPGWDANTKRTVAWFNSQNGTNGNVIDGNAAADPKLTVRRRPGVRLPVKEAGRRDCE